MTNGRLVAHIPGDCGKLTGPDGPEIVALRPAERLVPGDSIAIGKSGTRALEALNQPRDIETRRELEKHVHVVSNHAEGYQLRTVTLTFCRQELLQERLHRGIDEG